MGKAVGGNHSAVGTGGRDSSFFVYLIRVSQRSVRKAGDRDLTAPFPFNQPGLQSEKRRVVSCGSLRTAEHGLQIHRSMLNACGTTVRQEIERVFSDQTADGNFLWLVQGREQAVTYMAGYSNATGDGAAEGMAGLKNHLEYNVPEEMLHSLDSHEKSVASPGSRSMRSRGSGRIHSCSRSLTT